MSSMKYLLLKYSLFSCFAVILIPLTTQAADFFVAPGGDDTGPGSLEAPFATPARALEAARRVKEEPVIVQLRSGVYPLDTPLTFTPEDTRDEKAPLIIRAYRNERPILSAGVKLTGWEVGDDGRWRLTLDAVKEGQWNFGQLFAGDQRRLRPRVPAKGYFHIASNMPPTEANANRGFDRFRFKDADLNPDWSNLSDVEVITFHQWSTSRMRPASIDAARKVVNFTGTTPGLSGWTDFATNHRYFAVNVKEALSQPGQWYLDRPTGVLTYIPQPGETPDQTEVFAPRIDQVIVMAGDVKQHRWIQHIRFEGLTLAHTNWACEPDGESFPQAAINTNEAVAAIGTRNVRFLRCAIVHTGGYAMGLGAGCRNVQSEACEMVDLGGGGVKIGNAGGAHSWGQLQANPGDPESGVESITVRDCTIAHAGRIHPAAVGIWIGHASHNTVAHNHIFDLYYSGLSVGWTWGYAMPSRAHHNEIGWNHVHQIGQRVLSDMGGIYTLGVSPGTHVHHNTFHDIDSFSYGGWGLYTDEGSSEIVMDHNLVYNTKDGSFHQHYGRDNHVTNNILVNSQIWQIRRSRIEDHRSFIFDHNIVYWTLDTPLLGSNWKDGHYDIDYNLYWHGGRGFDFAGMSLEAWRAMGNDQHSLIADPRFVDPAASQFQLREDSPAKQIGFETWDDTKAGRVTPRSLTRDMPSVPATYE